MSYRILIPTSKFLNESSLTMGTLNMPTIWRCISTVSLNRFFEIVHSVFLAFWPTLDFVHVWHFLNKFRSSCGLHYPVFFLLFCSDLVVGLVGFFDSLGHPHHLSGRYPLSRTTNTGPLRPMCGSSRCGGDWVPTKSAETWQLTCNGWDWFLFEKSGRNLLYPNLRSQFVP